jgi:hypothetical protein
VIIKGQYPLSSFAQDQQPATWPFKSLTMQYYNGGESAVWNNTWLTDIPVEYTTDYSCPAN